MWRRQWRRDNVGVINDVNDRNDIDDEVWNIDIVIDIIDIILSIIMPWYLTIVIIDQWWLLMIVIQCYSDDIIDIIV